MRLGGLALVCILGACTEPTKALDAPPAEPGRAGPPAVEVIPEKVVPPKPDLPAVRPSEIGFSSVPKIGAKARTANRKALKLHRAGDYPGSREGFEEAIALSPDHDLARFNLACTLARLGELDASRSQLETLLHRDLLRFQTRWKTDADLEALRTSKHAPEIDALIDRLRTAYDDAHDQGIAAYLYDHAPSPAEIDYGGKRVGDGASTLVAGIWLHDARRFVPLARGGTVALLDLPNRRMRRTEVLLTELHCEYEVDETTEMISTDPDPEAKREVGSGGDATWMHVTSEGGKFHRPPPAGYTLERNRLTVPGRTDPIELDGEYEHVFATRDAEAPVFLLRRRYDYDGGSLEITFDATVARLDPTTGKTERIARAQGDAWVVVGPDDSVYVDIGGSARRWPTATATEPEDTMSGLHLMMPVGPPECMCCG